MTEIQRSAPHVPSLSGRYIYNGGVTGRRAGFVDADMRAYSQGELEDPRYALASPVFAEPAAAGRVGDEPAITLHVDIDGVDPLGVVSGKGAGRSGARPLPEHF